MANLGYTLSDQTVGNILQRHGIPAAPKRERTTTRADFIRAHMSVLAGTDFFSVEVLTLRGLVTYYVLFFIHLDSRKVEIAGMTPHPNEAWMTQIARNVTMDEWASSVIAGISSMIVIPSIVNHFGILSNLAMLKRCDSPHAAQI
jgi:hypothetical protein